MNDILTAFITPVFVTIITIIGKHWMSKTNTDLRNSIDEIKEYIGINQNNDSIIKKMADIKNYYLSQFTNEMWRDVANERSTALVGAMKTILDLYVIELSNWSAIKMSFDVYRNRLNTGMIAILGTEQAQKLKKERDRSHKEYCEQIEKILANIKNHHKEQFAEISSNYLREIMKSMLKVQHKNGL